MALSHILEGLLRLIFDRIFIHIDAALLTTLAFVFQYHEIFVSCRYDLTQETDLHALFFLDSIGFNESHVALQRILIYLL